MPSLRQKKGNFYALFYDKYHHPNQKWVALRTKQKAVARQKLAQLERDQAMGLFDPWADRAPEAGVTVAKAVERFLKAKRHLRPKTLEVYEEVLTRFARGLAPDLVVGRIEPRHLAAFVDRPELSDASRASYYRHLRAFCNWATKEGLFQHNPVERVAAPKVGKKEAHFLTPSEVERFIAAVETDTELKGGLVLPGQNAWLVDVVRVAVCTGLRRGELVNLRWGDLDLANRLLVVRSRGDFKTKSGHERRVPIVSDAHSVFERLRDEHGEVNDDARVFLSPKGNPLRGDYVTKRFRHFRRMAKLPEEVHFHSLRHTCASWLVMRGVPLPVVQQILGHSDIAVTQRYAHLAPGAVRGEMERAFGEIDRGEGRIEEPAAPYVIAA